MYMLPPSGQKELHLRYLQYYRYIPSLYASAFWQTFSATYVLFGLVSRALVFTKHVQVYTSDVDMQVQLWPKHYMSVFLWGLDPLHHAISQLSLRSSKHELPQSFLIMTVTERWFALFPSLIKDACWTRVCSASTCLLQQLRLSGG